MSIRSEMQLIVEERAATGATITAEYVLEQARDAAKFPKLNEHLWQVRDEELIAEARIARVHRILLTMRVTVAETGDVTRLLVHTPGIPGYHAMQNVVRIPDIARARMQQLSEDIARARARLRAFRAALPEELSSEVDAHLEAASARLAEESSDIAQSAAS